MLFRVGSILDMLCIMFGYFMYIMCCLCCSFMGIVIFDFVLVVFVVIFVCLVGCGGLFFYVFFGVLFEWFCEGMFWVFLLFVFFKFLGLGRCEGFWE